MRFGTDATRRAIAVLSILAAFPAGAGLREVYDALRTPTFPTYRPAVSDHIDDQPDTLGRYVVTTRAQADEIRSADGVVDAIRVNRRQVAVTTTLPEREVRRLADVTHAEPDASGRIYSADTSYGLQWALQNDGQATGNPAEAGAAGADMRWSSARTQTGAGVVVAVIDSGIDFAHPDLVAAQFAHPGEPANRCSDGKDQDANGYIDDCRGWDFVNNDRQQYDTTTSTGAAVDNGHGTHVAGTIAATADNNVGIAGVAPGVKIMPLKINENGAFPMSRAALAVEYAVANGAHIINASWGADTPSTALDAAIAKAEAAGVTIIAAAGNTGTNNDTSARYPANSSSAAVTTVGATTSSDLRASFSNFGATTVDVFAPGANILSTLPGSAYGYASGTSMAAPHVTGLAALLKSQNTTITPTQIRAKLIASVDTLRTAEGASVSGGRVDAATALGVSETSRALTYSFNSFHAFTSTVEGTANVSITPGSRAAVPTDAQVDVIASLAVVDDGKVKGVIGHLVNGVATDVDAQVSLSNGPLPAARRNTLATTGLTFPVTTKLPSGDYALLVELIDAARSNQPLIGSRRAVLFSVSAGTTSQATPTPSPTATATATPAPAAPAPTPTPAATAAPAPAASPPASTAGAPAPTPTPTGSAAPAEPAPTASATAAPPPPAAEPSPAPSPTVTAAPAPSDAPSGEGTPTPQPTTAPAPPPGDASRVFPNSGRTAGGDLVTVTLGSILTDPYVAFDGANAPIQSSDSSSLTVQTPPHVAGVVDVTVTGIAGTTITLPAAYTYTDGPPAPSSPPTTSPTPSASPSPSPTAAPPPPPRVSVRTDGKVTQTTSGLNVAAFVQAHPLSALTPASWAATGCTSASCAGLTL